MEELRIKLRIVESKRAEDLERLRALESQVRDAEDLKRIQDVAHGASSFGPELLLHDFLTCASSQPRCRRVQIQARPSTRPSSV